MGKNIRCQDFKLDKNDDIEIINGDFAIEFDANLDHIDSVLQAFKGEYKNAANLGIGINRFLNSNVSKLELKKHIKEGLKEDFFELKELEIDKENDTFNLSIKADKKK